jgi:hypothetical protein
MSKSVLRKDKTCLNCRHVVDQRFCPNCGQENSESRKTFHHLFIHFFEDLTHYENAFWRTIKNLLFKPAALTKEYLSGKRLSYLAPVRLYIFISFITFFLITVIPDSEDHLVKANQTQTVPVVDKDGVIKDSIIAKTTGLSKIIEKEREKDSIQNGKSDKLNLFGSRGYKSVKELDSMQQYGPKSEHMSRFKYWVSKKFLTVSEHNTRSEIIEKFKESFVHNLSKVLFLYMPIFALFLWLIHGKKRWYYFDHGIFTLHYFSFLLLMLLIIFLGDLLLTSFGDSLFITVVNGVFHFVSFTWTFYYFFPAHHRFYGESRPISFLKSIVTFSVNSVLIICMLILFAVYTFINLH